MSKRIALSLLAAAGVWLSVGTCSYATDMADDAKLSTPEPTTALEHNNRALELAKHGRWTEAIDEHEAAVAQDPNNKTFKANLSASLIRCADSLMGKKSYERAAELYKRALNVDADNLSAKSGLNEASKLASSAEKPL